MIQNDIPDICPVCESRDCSEDREDFQVGMPDLSILVVPQILVWHCNQCGARWLGPVSSDAVDHFVRKGGKWGSGD